MAFNPDEYLQKTAPSGFDPDAYLAKVQGGPGTKTGAGQAALEHYGNAATMGYLPHAQALTEKAADAASGSALKGAGLSALGPLGTMVATLSAMRSGSKGADERLKSRGFQVTQPEATYVGSRDENARRLKLEGEEHPVASGVGTVAGVVGGGLLTAPLAGARAATAGGRILQGAKAGAVMGAAANPGDIEGEVDPIQLDKRIQGAKLGGAIGGTMAGAVEVLGPLAAKARDYLKDKANEKAFKALGRPTPTLAAKLSESGQDKQIGRTLLDEGAIPVLGTPKQINAKVTALKDTAGEKYGSLLDQAGTAKVVDTEALAIKILDSPELAAARKTPGMESTVAAIEKQVETLAKNGQLTLREAQVLRQGIDKSINFTKGAPDLRGAQEGLYQQRTAIADALNEGVNKLLPGAGKDALKAAGRKYSNLATAADIGERQIARDTTNRAVSLTDTIAGAGGLGAGGPGWGIMAGALNKAGRAVGNAVMARSADAASNLFAKTPSLVAFARNNPMLASVIASRIAQPGGTEQQYFKELEDPQVLTLFKANPQLIDSVQDPKLKAAILKRVGQAAGANRSPSEK